ncbi:MULTISPECIES: hypothetical protein [unclassified Microbacterium]|uniref:hypothetical protein n=1 Tax=unclassified Microbacterium TaxID=2609290 RepID=UPI000C2C59C3|nr:MULTISPECIES: hypothetical protein [unclassified Microbacterium]
MTERSGATSDDQDRRSRRVSPEERKARDTAARKAWNEAHPDYYRDYRERNRESIRAKGRERERERRVRMKAEAEQRRQKMAAEAERRRRDVERAREWAQRNPDKKREQRRLYVENNRERVRALQLAYYYRNREQILQNARERRLADPDKRRQQQRRWQQANPEKVRENQRRYRSNPETAEKARAYNREWKRRERRRQQAGLPPRRLHPASEEERAANLAAATEFFTRRRLVSERRRLMQHFERTPRPLLEEWMRKSALARRRQIVPDYLVEHGERLRDEVTLDSRARQARGADPYDLETEVRRRAIAAVRRARADPQGRLREDASAPTHGTDAYIDSSAARVRVPVRIRP